MNCGSRSSPAKTSAGSPGNNCCSEKMMTDTKNSVGPSCSSRLPWKLSTPAPLGPPGRTIASSLLQLEPDHSDQPVGNLRVALEPGGVRDQHAAVVDIELRIVLENDLGELLVDRLAHGEIGRHA